LLTEMTTVVLPVPWNLPEASASL